MTRLHVGGTWYVPEGGSSTVRFPELREGNGEGVVYFWRSRGEVFAPVRVEEADTDDLLLLDQHYAESIVSTVEAVTEYDPSIESPADVDWIISRPTANALDVDPVTGPTDAGEAME